MAIDSLSFRERVGVRECACALFNSSKRVALLFSEQATKQCQSQIMLPAFIHMNGLGQAMAFFKKQGPEGKGLRGLVQHSREVAVP